MEDTNKKEFEPLDPDILTVDLSKLVDEKLYRERFERIATRIMIGFAMRSFLYQSIQTKEIEMHAELNVEELSYGLNFLSRE